MSDTRRIKIFDTTLRDGEQSPGCSMNLTEKMEIAQALVDLGVDIIEAGFPIASPGDFEAVREIANTIRGSTICGLARCNDADIDRAWEALKKAPKSRIHVFLATSAIHREFKLKMTREEIVARAVAGVSGP
jgi:2-isopropylmalate synthase